LSLLPCLKERGEDWHLIPKATCGGFPATFRVMQLLLKLWLNAPEAMDPGNNLTMRVGDQSQWRVDPAGQRPEAGSGVPDDMTQHMFKPATTEIHWTGRGVAICRAIADAHKAILRAHNHTGRSGSAFTVEFPVPSVKPTGVPA
jgi:nitrogen-specific signal transduction histidine kinase